MANEDASSVTSSLDAAEGRRVLLLRHGQAVHNVGPDVPDAPLTALGKVQAGAWRNTIHEFDAEVVLISPLTRAVQTACLAFESDAAPMEMCRWARELWWDEEANQPGSIEKMQLLLQGLPRGSEVHGLEKALNPGVQEPMTEGDSVEALRTLLLRRPEERVAVVTHWGVINGLCGHHPDNCELVECSIEPQGKLTVVSSHLPPGARMRRWIEPFFNMGCHL
eukprot:TRINITY_DN37325_c0_g1_i1.p1 TRINITY_DN37325_c0_g1~~TRINITY_DN37325_c0_g1_i1.p1  ORF type:complete len:233 (-),score=39.70 TRINITY_DN37325_c0_g1_i1:326-991(-)